jgi:hypothetical protein
MGDVEVKPSRIEGLGIFATRPFRAGDRIRRVNVVREITPDAPLREDLGERIEHCSYPDGKVVLYGFPDRHVNHSCDPDAHELFEAPGSYLVARRAIAAGDEITCDYNINIADGTAWPCNCGAARCRGEVAGDFFRLPTEWQHEYRPLLAEWFVRRHRERIDALDRTDDFQPVAVGRVDATVCVWCGRLVEEDEAFMLRVGARLCPACAAEAGRIAAEQRHGGGSGGSPTDT